MKRFLFIAVSVLFISAVFALPVSASTTDGTIDSTYKYGWGENIGWVNFGCGNCGVHITDSGLSGYALGENIGWLYLGDVVNDGSGNLSGYAWSENAGWVKFNPTNGGVVINSSGEFTGSALGENIGWIIFNCSISACVKTDWRPRSARPACNNAIDDDGDGKIDYPSDPGCSSLDDTDETDPVTGGGMPSAWYNPPVSPIQGFAVSINNNAEYTDNLTVTLNLRGGSDTERMAISNFADFRDAGQEAYVSTKSWNLCKGQEDICEKLRAGELTSYEFRTYAKFYAPWGTVSNTVSDKIAYRKGKTVIERINEIPEIIKKPLEIFKPFVPEFLKPKPSEIIPEEIPVEELMPKEAPSAFQNKWQLLHPKPIREFVLAPLPKEIADLVKKFPELYKTFEQLGITRITDIEKLQGIKLTLPGLTERLGLKITNVESDKLSFPQGVPLEQLSAELKKEIPSEIVFAKTGGQLVDLNINLTVTEEGLPRQTITTISGKPLQLAVKPEAEVNSIKGYVVFLSKQKSEKTQIFSMEMPLNYFLGSVISSFAKIQKVPIEQKLVLQEFDYADDDGDGIYTASIQAPLVEGEYEIITVMDYKDIKIGKKEIRLITVVDPEGYVYAQLAEGKLLIAGAAVSLFWQNPETKQYELWPAKAYQQGNPQVTGDKGKYSFLVPEGNYYLKVEAKGYQDYEGGKFEVLAGGGIHSDIELKSDNWRLKVVDFKIIISILLSVVIVLLSYNFYRDKMRDRIKNKKL